MAINTWHCYGRHLELTQMERILARKRWFFLQISGRRRIGKTALIQQALTNLGYEKTLYIQIPYSDAVGVVAACNGYLETFGLGERVSSLAGFAKLIGRLVRQGNVVALDEFQYFHHKQLVDFTSYLQSEVDQLSAIGHEITGGLIVLGSLYAEMTALLANSDAPLYNRTTSSLNSVENVRRCLAMGHLFYGGRLPPKMVSGIIRPLYTGTRMSKGYWMRQGRSC